MILYYQAADIFILASRADTFPNTILEAQACGTPVVATDVGGIPEQVADGSSGILVPQGDSIAMAEAAIRILNDPILSKKMGQTAAEHVVKNFDLNQQVSSNINFYRKCLAAR